MFCMYVFTICNCTTLTKARHRVFEVKKKNYTTIKICNMRQNDETTFTTVGKKITEF